MASPGCPFFVIVMAWRACLALLVCSLSSRLAWTLEWQEKPGAGEGLLGSCTLRKKRIYSDVFHMLHRALCVYVFALKCLCRLVYVALLELAFALYSILSGHLCDFVLQVGLRD